MTAFGRFSSQPGASEALRRSLTHRDLRMRRDAAEALGKAGDVRTAALLRPLLDDREEQVRAEAKKALKKLGVK